MSRKSPFAKTVAERDYGPKPACNENERQWGNPTTFKRRRRQSSGDLWQSADKSLTRNRAPQPLLSVVVPCFNEDTGICEFHRRLSRVLDEMPLLWEVIYVNDGSNDGTLPILKQLQATHEEVGVIDLSRNFGKEVATSAGLEHASGDAIVVIDADLQDPPEVIVDMVQTWRESGCDVVYGRRRSRAGETWLKKFTARMFYRVINAIADHPLPSDTGDFRLLSRRALDSLLQMPERRRFMKGLFSWIGYTQVAVDYDRDQRYAGETKWNYWKLWNFSLEGITSFSTLPLKISTYVGLIGAVTATVYAIYMALHTLIMGNPVAGYPSLVVIILMIGSLQMICLGIIGEYLGRIFIESKQRPLYFVRDRQPPSRMSSFLPTDQLVSVPPLRATED